MKTSISLGVFWRKDFVVIIITKIISILICDLLEIYLISRKNHLHEKLTILFNLCDFAGLLKIDFSSFIRPSTFVVADSPTILLTSSTVSIVIFISLLMCTVL
jgi:hypothetical protein